MTGELEKAIIEYLDGEDKPILRDLIPSVIGRTGATEEEIKAAIVKLNKEHEFSINIDSNLELHFYCSYMAQCSKCGKEWDACNYDAFGGGIYYTGIFLNKESLCRDCEQEIVEDWYARGKPKLERLWKDEEESE